jgi:hypothetical protein
VIAWPSLSQNVTVNLPFEVAKMVALDLEELDRLREVEGIQNLQIETYKAQVWTLGEISREKSKQIELLKDNIQLLEVQLEAEKTSKPKLKRGPWILAVIGALGVGFIAGSI